MLRALRLLGMKEECRALGLDQGFHNYLFYTGQLGDGAIFQAAESVVHTVSCGLAALCVPSPYENKKSTEAAY
jgi:hypothetical protein